MYYVSEIAEAPCVLASPLQLGLKWIPKGIQAENQQGQHCEILTSKSCASLERQVKGNFTAQELVTGAKYGRQSDGRSLLFFAKKRLPWKACLTSSFLTTNIETCSDFFGGIKEIWRVTPKNIAWRYTHVFGIIYRLCKFWFQEGCWWWEEGIWYQCCRLNAKRFSCRWRI